MKPDNLKLSVFVRSILFGAAILVSASASAKPEEPDRQMMPMQLGQVHDKLKLTEQQEALWGRATAASRKQMQTHIAERRDAIKEYREALDNPQVDLRALSSKMDQRRDRATKESRETRELWLAVYDSLDSAQRQIARKFLLQRVQQMEHAMDRMKHRQRNRHAQDDTPHIF